MNGFSDYVLYFIIYSFLGWLLESIYASINERKFINRGFLTGFFCPIYGYGAILIIQTSTWINFIFEDYLVALIFDILFSIILVTLLEFVTGLALEKIFKCKWWDYSKNAFNLKGYICLKTSLLWGVMAFILIQVVHPFISKLVYPMPTFTKDYIAAVILLYLLADTVRSIYMALNLRDAILNFSNYPDNKYYEIIMRNKKLFFAFPHLLFLNAGVINRDVRSILNGRFKKVKEGLKSRLR